MFHSIFLAMGRISSPTASSFFEVGSEVALFCLFPLPHSVSSSSRFSFCFSFCFFLFLLFLRLPSSTVLRFAAYHELDTYFREPVQKRTANRYESTNSRFAGGRANSVTMLQTAGTIAACFGMANFFSRPMGGLVSDRMGKRFGVRGRLWGLWGVQTVAGLLCVLLGRVDSLWSSVVVMCCFSVFVQAASGLTFGVVPFVSKRSLGVISGMTGSGGTIGAVVTQLLLFSGDDMSKQTSISLMGLVMICCTLPVTLIYFPQWGGMFCGPALDHMFISMKVIAC